MKSGSIRDLDIYLGMTIKKMCLQNGMEAWASSPSKYVWALIDMVTKYLTDLGGNQWKISKKAVNPFEGGYKLELVVTPLPGVELVSWYALLISML
jgi:hypothetical protein